MKSQTEQTQEREPPVTEACTMCNGRERECPNYKEVEGTMICGWYKATGIDLTRYIK